MYESEYQRNKRLQNVLIRYGEEYYDKLVEIENSNIDQICKNYIIENTDDFLSFMRGGYSKFSLEYNPVNENIQKHVNEIVSNWDRKFPYHKE